MKHQFAASLIVAASLVTGVATPAAHADYPKPSLYPISWELRFTHSTPKRIVVSLPGTNAPKAYWYMTYTVVNPNDRELTFLPLFELLTEDGRIVRSDKNIPGQVLATIRARETNPSLLSHAQVGGTLRIGEDQAKDGIAVWEELPGRPGHFSIFVQGLSGESAKVKGPDGKDITLRKSLQLNYLIRGDEIYPGEDEINENPSRWVMR